MTDHLAALVAKDAIVDVITRLFIATDERDWAAARACLAPTLHVDMSSAGAGPAGRAAGAPGPGGAAVTSSPGTSTTCAGTGWRWWNSR